MLRFRAKRWKIEDLAKRLAQMFYGTEEAWHDTSGGNDRWHVGNANDLWLHSQGDGVYRLHYRYARDERMKALGVMLEWRLDVEVLPDD